MEASIVVSDIRERVGRATTCSSCCVDPSSAFAPTSSPSPSTLSRKPPGVPCTPSTSFSAARHTCMPSASILPRRQRRWSPRWGRWLAVSRMSAHDRRVTSKL